MKKKLTSVLLFLISFNFYGYISAQEHTFEYSRISLNDEFARECVQSIDDNSYFTIGSSTKKNSNHNNSILLKIDEYGNLLQSREITDSTQSLNLQSVSLLSADTILLCGIKHDTSADYKQRINCSFVFYKVNKDFETIETKSFPLPPSYASGQSFFKQSGSKRFFYGGLLDSIGAFTIKPFLYEFSESFDSLCLNFWPDSTGSVQDIKVLEPNKYWSLIHGFKSWAPNYYFFDSLYNVTRFEDLLYDLSDPFGVKWNSDTTFYITGEWNGGPDDDIGIAYQLYDDPNNYDKNIFNSWGTLDTLDLPAFRGGLGFNNNDSVYIGGVSHWYTSILEIDNYLFFLQTDSLLNIKWQRFYGGDAYYALSNLITTSDGGCLAVGSKYNYHNKPEQQRNIFVLKLNNEGLLVGSEETPSIEMHEAIVYPNPGTTEIKVRIAAQYHESLFQLFDMNGKQVASEKIVGKWGTINTNFLKSGTYIYRISSKDGLFESGKWVKQ